MNTSISGAFLCDMLLIRSKHVSSSQNLGEYVFYIVLMHIFVMIVETGVVLRLNQGQTRDILRVVRKISYVQKNVPQGTFFEKRTFFRTIKGFQYRCHN